MDSNKTYIIAEAGVNHNGDLNLARELIVQASNVGADAIKFQSFSADTIVHPKTAQTKYQSENCGDDTQYNLLKKLELTWDDMIELQEFSKNYSIDFLSTPFDLSQLELLLKLDVPYLKVSSGDLTFGPLLLKMAQSDKKIILSTGMATYEEIERALEIIAFGIVEPKTIPESTYQIKKTLSSKSIREVLYDRVILCHCTSAYPAPIKDINLNVLDSYSKRFGLKLGYSDHSKGSLVPALAVAKGARLIEKHITLDNDMKGPDHKASLNINDFKMMIDRIRDAEIILGSPVKTPTPSELENKPLVRRGVYAARDIIEGRVIKYNDLICLRPSNNKIDPIKFWDLIGSKALRSYSKLEPINE